jgi:Acyl-CoA dehydrogenases
MEVYIEGTMAITLKAIHEFQKSFKETPPYTERYHYARLLTHIAKNLTADMSSYVTRLAMELHGGIGFLSEFPVERWHREALITPIWEGTSNIQALDMLEAIVKKSAHLPLLKELEDMAIDLKACETHALELYKHAHTRAESTLKSLNALSEEEAQFFAKDVLSELGHALAVATLVHASYRLSSKRLLNVAEVYHEKFVEKKAIGTRQEKERKNIIEIDEGF